MKKLRKAFALLAAVSLVYVGGGVFFSCSSDSDDSTAANPTTSTGSGTQKPAEDNPENPDNPDNPNPSEPDTPENPDNPDNPNPGEPENPETAEIEKIELLVEENAKTSYFVGDELDVTGLSIKVTYKGSTEENPNVKTVAVTKEMVSGFDSSAAGEKTLTVTYDEKIAGTYTVSVAEDSVVEITAKLADSEKTWNEGDSISASDVKVSAAYLSGKTAQLLSEAYTVSPAALAKGENEITVTYGSGENAKTATFKINAAVLPKILSVSIPASLTIEAEAESSITATATTEGTPAPAVTYTWSVVGDGLTFTQTNGNVLSIKGNNTDETSSKTVKVTVTATANEKTVSSEECVITVEKHGVTVKNEVKSVSIVESGSKEIACDGELSLTANVSATGSVNAEYDWIVTGDTDSVEIEKNSNVIKITGKNADTKNKKTVTVKATAKGGETTTAVESEEITITIGAAPVVVTGVELVKAETVKAKYYVGDTLDVTGLSLKLTKNDGTEENVDVTKLMVSEFDSTTAGEKTITVTYNGNVAGSYTVTVFEDTVASISAVVSTNKLWFEGNTVSASDLSVTAKYESGKTADLTTSDYVVSSAALVAGENEITVTYGSGENAKTTKVTVTAVADTVKSITVELADSTKAWKEGDKVSASDFTVTATYESGKTETPTSGITVEPTTLLAGENAITVTYGGKSASVSITATALPRASFSVKNYLSDGDISLSKTANGLALTVPADITASSVKWSVNGAEKTVTGNSATLADLGITKRGQYVVSVVVTGANGTKYTASASVTLSRSAQ